MKSKSLARKVITTIALIIGVLFISVKSVSASESITLEKPTNAPSKIFVKEYSENRGDVAFFTKRYYNALYSGYLARRGGPAFQAPVVNTYIYEYWGYLYIDGSNIPMPYAKEIEKTEE